MGIQLWSGFNHVQSYYKAYDIPKVTPQEVEAQQSKEQKNVSLQANQEAKIGNAVLEQDNRSKAADLENISLTFNKEDTFDYLGSESGLANLDMQKAISDMKKDSVLQEYQYFVGSSQNFFRPEDGIVLQK